MIQSISNGYQGIYVIEGQKLSQLIVYADMMEIRTSDEVRGGVSVISSSRQLKR